MLTIDQLKIIYPRFVKNPHDCKILFPLLTSAMSEGKIDTVLRQAAFLGQLGHESMELYYMSEVWGPTPAQVRYEPPSPLATKLGNTQKGDGYRYRGAGPIQITGRDNFRRGGLALGLDLENHPELAFHPEVGFRLATWYWTSRGLNELADRKDFDTITQKINGGQNGALSRKRYYTLALKVLS